MSLIDIFNVILLLRYVTAAGSDGVAEESDPESDASCTDLALQRANN